ncbi:glycosyltransferase family 2 protein [Clostridium perfringens]|uniref:glycosyltransferase family 2 protein n=1 Tax=Clostridium perfringens TaxID=1502 RepID=UPI0018993E12|nr:glycosyltransferase family 2 protein [Clostridium perfringens]MDM0445799.1 glycosyltransferase family 2 protein [Clostridium perfringens]MDM0451534.1 glycosyltransferase family 2 protein [Clostridium perfringens]
MSKISIIVPLYNSEKYLDKCIKLILNQTFKNFELILVNDGSKDKSLEICNKYAKRILG